MKKFAIVNINIQIPVPNNADEQKIQEIIQDYELPHGYVCDSFEFVKVVDEDDPNYELTF